MGLEEWVSMEKYYEVNKRRWSELVDIHAKSDEYDLDGFLAGKNSLHSIELEALGTSPGSRCSTSSVTSA